MGHLAGVIWPEVAAQVLSVSFPVAHRIYWSDFLRQAFQECFVWDSVFEMLPCQSEQKRSSLHAGCRLFTCPLIPLKGLTAARMPLWRTTRQLAATVASDAEAFLHGFGTGWGRHSVVRHFHKKVRALSLSLSLSSSLSLSRAHVCVCVCVCGGGGVTVVLFLYVDLFFFQFEAVLY